MIVRKGDLLIAKSNSEGNIYCITNKGTNWQGTVYEVNQYGVYAFTTRCNNEGVIGMYFPLHLKDIEKSFDIIKAVDRL